MDIFHIIDLSPDEGNEEHDEGDEQHNEDGDMVGVVKVGKYEGEINGILSFEESSSKTCQMIGGTLGLDWNIFHVLNLNMNN